MNREEAKGIAKLKTLARGVRRDLGLEDHVRLENIIGGFKLISPTRTGNAERFVYRIIIEGEDGRQTALLVEDLLLRTFTYKIDWEDFFKDHMKKALKPPSVEW